MNGTQWGLFTLWASSNVLSNNSCSFVAVCLDILLREVFFMRIVDSCKVPNAKAQILLTIVVLIIIIIIIIITILIVVTINNNNDGDDDDDD